MPKDTLEYRVRRRAELAQHLGMPHINAHVALVERTKKNQLAADHVALRARAARAWCSARELEFQLHPRVVKALALVAVQQMILDRAAV